MASIFDEYIGEPAELAKEKLEKQGYRVEVLKNSKPKIKTDSELVVVVKQVGEHELKLIVGDFLINVGDDDGMV